jgi:hypothetical protein
MCELAIGADVDKPKAIQDNAILDQFPDEPAILAGSLRALDFCPSLRRP